MKLAFLLHHALPCRPFPSLNNAQTRDLHLRHLCATRLSHNHGPAPRTMQLTQPSLSNSPQVAIVEIGCGTDLHGQDATVAAVRACRNAIEFNSLPGLSRLLPDGDLSRMQVRVRLGVPNDFCSDVQIDRVKQQFPYGTVSVEVVEGGLTCSSGIVLPEQGDRKGDDRAIVVVAAVEVAC